MYAENSYNGRMALTVLDLSPEALKKYRPVEAVRRRRRKNSTEVSKRRRRARSVVRKAAKLLYDDYGAKKVYVFGSLVRYGGFSLWSDVDLAVIGIASNRFFEAVGVITGLSKEFKIDLVDLDSCSPTMGKSIKETGKEL